jgi:hypothetical protein
MWLADGLDAYAPSRSYLVGCLLRRKIFVSDPLVVRYEFKRSVGAICPALRNFDSHRMERRVKRNSVRNA